METFKNRELLICDTGRKDMEQKKWSLVRTIFIFISSHSICSQEQEANRSTVPEVTSDFFLFCLSLAGGSFAHVVRVHVELLTS